MLSKLAEFMALKALPKTEKGTIKLFFWEKKR
ncbi:hypothetical protein N752_28130 [Desulforamulus aquiferis]|nr:hypothetical protein N752_28130 [Desulforamulus aquiferis]